MAENAETEAGKPLLRSRLELLFSCVIGKDLGRFNVGVYTGRLKLFLKFINMIKGKSSDCNALSLFGGVLTGIASEDDNIKERVTHETVASVDSSHRLTGEWKEDPEAEKSACLAGAEAVRILTEWDRAKAESGKRYYFPGLTK